jgi:putative phage-type endonuclease
MTRFAETNLKTHPALHTMMNKSTQVCEDDFVSDDDSDDSVDNVDFYISDKDELAILHFMADFLEEHAIKMSSPDFRAEVVEAAVDAFTFAFQDFDALYDYLEDLVDEVYVPPRSSSSSYLPTLNLVPPGTQTEFTHFPKENVLTKNNQQIAHPKGRRGEAGEPGFPANLALKLEALRKVPQPEQRTAAWFQFRHNVITASAVGKIFASDAQRNSLIYEKCKPLPPPAASVESCGSLPNFDSPLHWGQKYEPVSVMIYEHMFQTRVGEFGCIQHPQCACLAASPDGINVDPASPLYGRMLEIKNIVNREITGVPLEMYWIQMQIQMEVCDLDVCDFWETRFREYASVKEFEQDDDCEYKGVLLLFLDPTLTRYRYKVALEEKQKDEWINQMRLENWCLYQTMYWYLEEYSCVLVERNRPWFAAARPDIESTWATVLHERQHGCEHRAPKKQAGEEEKSKRATEALAQLFYASQQDDYFSSTAAPPSSHHVVDEQPAGND